MNRPPSSCPSIAVSAVVHPSRILLSLVLLYGVFLLASAMLIGFSYIGDFPLYVCLFVIFLTFLALSVALNWAVRQRKVVRLDISMNGQIRLVEHNGLTGSPSLCAGEAGSGCVVQLMSDSVLWPGLLLLRLKTEANHIIALPILRDSMNADAFRALSVACRWIAAQNKSADGELV
jgi:toxin CptA